MSESSKIEWTDATWNPVRGCKKISPGCAHCYAETFSERFRGVKGHPYEQGFDLKLVPEKLIDPFLWNSPKTVFVNSMSDLFQDGIETDFIRKVVDVMTFANWHTYQVLTKRSERMRDLLNNELRSVAQLSHLWWGVSVEDKKYGVPRIEHLRNSVAKVRFLSIEPLLEDLGKIDLTGIHWVIVGGESGLGARPIKEDWVTSILEQCRKARIPFFFKQWGGRHKSKTGRELNGKTFDQIPNRAMIPIPDKKKRLEIARLVLSEEQVAQIHAKKKDNPGSSRTAVSITDAPT
ncbi:MAG: phage Gp37/Gp68 family protein [Acidobacteriota bacterium]